MPSKTKTDPNVAAKCPVTPTQEQPPAPLEGQARQEDEESSSRSLEDPSRREGGESSSSLDDEMRHDDDESSSRSLEDRAPMEDPVAQDEPSIDNPNVPGQIQLENQPQVQSENLVELDIPPQIPRQVSTELGVHPPVTFEGIAHVGRLSTPPNLNESQVVSASPIAQHDPTPLRGRSLQHEPEIPSGSHSAQHQQVASGSSSVQHDPQVPSASGGLQHKKQVGKQSSDSGQQTLLDSPMVTDDEASSGSETSVEELAIEAAVRQERLIPPPRLSARWLDGQWFYLCQRRYGREGQAGCSTWVEGECPSFADPKEVTSYYTTQMRFAEHEMNENEGVPDSSDSSAELEKKRILRENKLRANSEQDKGPGATKEKAKEPPKEPSSEYHSSDDSDIEIRRPKHVKHTKPQGKKGSARKEKNAEDTQLGAMLADTKSNQPSSSLFGTPPRDSFLGSFLSDTKSNQPLPDFMLGNKEESNSPPAVVIEEEVVPDFRKTRASRQLSSESYVNSRVLRQMEINHLKLAIERSLQENWRPTDGLSVQRGIALPPKKRQPRRDPPPPPSGNVLQRSFQEQPSTSKSVQNIIWHKQRVHESRANQPVHQQQPAQDPRSLPSGHEHNVQQREDPRYQQQPGQDPRLPSPVQMLRSQHPGLDPRLQHPGLDSLSYQSLQDPQLHQQLREDPLHEYSARDLRIRHPVPDPRSPKQPRQETLPYYPAEDPRLHQYSVVQDLRVQKQPERDPRHYQQQVLDPRLHQEHGYDPRPRQEPGQYSRFYHVGQDQSLHQRQVEDFSMHHQQDQRHHQQQAEHDPQLHQRPVQDFSMQQPVEVPILHQQSVQDLQTPRSPEETSPGSQQTEDEENKEKVVPYRNLNELLQRFEEYNHIMDYTDSSPRQVLHQPIAQHPMQHQLMYQPRLHHPPSAAAGSERQMLEQLGMQLHESVVAQSELVAQHGMMEGSPVRSMRGSPRRGSPRRGSSQTGSPRGKGYKRKQPQKSSEDEN